VFDRELSELEEDLFSRRRRKRRRALNNLRAEGVSEEARLDVLARAAESDNEDVRMSAVIGIGLIGTTEAYELLKQVATRGDEIEDEFVRREAVQWMVGNEAATVADLQAIASNDNSSVVRREARNALAQLSGPATHRVCPECSFAVEITDENREGSLFCDDGNVIFDRRPTATKMVARALTNAQARVVKRTGRL
jgi:HEAT repeat protein